ncbi:MAG: nucleotidyltransferase family protein, partial [Bacteroidales bacterium]|nr:nucleotidyltransferase family protein [Bacteroidales bacterium]
MHTPKPTKEQQLLFKLLKGAPPTSLEGIDTAKLFDLFRRHRLFPLAPELLPLLEEGERERWKKAIYTRTIRSMHHIAVLSQLTKALEKAGIEAIPIKGPVLSQHLYGNIGARHFSDLDVLVRGVESQQVIKIVEKLGFSLKFPRPGISARQWKYYTRHKKHFGLYNGEQGVMLELHTSIENHVVLKPDDVSLFLKETEMVEVGGTSFRCMNKAYTFLYLTLHGGVHQYRRLFWLRDVAEALEQWEIDHRNVLAISQKMRIEHILGVSLLLSKAFFNTEIPPAYSDYLERNRKLLQKLTHSSVRMITGPEFPDMKGKIGRHIFMLRLKSSLRHKYRVISEIAHRLTIGKLME